MTRNPQLPLQIDAFTTPLRVVVLTDDPLLRTGLGYDPQEAGRVVKEQLLRLLPE